MGILSWIIFGALAGWVASIIVGNNSQQGCLGNIFTGIIGAFLGGFIVRLVTGDGVNFDFDFYSFGVAVLGSILLLWLLGNRR